MRKVSMATAKESEVGFGTREMVVYIISAGQAESCYHCRLSLSAESSIGKHS